MLRRNFELRQEGPGVITGTILRYGDVANIGGFYRERFESGSVSWDDVILNLHHDRKQPVARTGAGLTIQDSGGELRLRAEIPDTIYGRQARELIDNNIVRGLSAEFIPSDESFDNNVRVIKRAELFGVGIVDKPAYPASTIDRSMVFPLHYRQRGLSAFIAYGVPFITSLAKRQKRIIVPGALGMADNIFLLDGYDYGKALASTAAASLVVNATRRGIGFTAPSRGLRKAPAWPDVRKRINAGLLNGITPGMQIVDKDEYTDKDGFSVTRILRGGLCELNTVAREGAGEFERSRRWLF